MAKNNPPFKLPKDPVDQYEVSWYCSHTVTGRFELYELKCLYHINTPWKSLYKDIGADFTNEWQCFRDGRFYCRWTEWSLDKLNSNWDEAYLTKAEAYQAGIDWANTQINELDMTRDFLNFHLIELYQKLSDEKYITD